MAAEEIMKQVTIQNTQPAFEIALSGEIDASNADEFFDEVIAAYNREPKDIIFLCGELEFIDSTTLGTFVKLLKHVRTDGHNMALRGLSPRLKKLFVICALDTIMEID